MGVEMYAVEQLKEDLIMSTVLKKMEDCDFRGNILCFPMFSHMSGGAAKWLRM